GHSPFEDKFHNNQDLIIAITCHKTREISIANTPEDYKKLYKKCWKQDPEQRPIIKENNSDPDSKIGDSIQLDTFQNLS
ncbi:1288_t:CDS:2, partial [Funneliformis geosporum]